MEGFQQFKKLWSRNWTVGPMSLSSLLYCLSKTIFFFSTKLPRDELARARGAVWIFLFFSPARAFHHNTWKLIATSFSKENLSFVSSYSFLLFNPFQCCRTGRPLLLRKNALRGGNGQSAAMSAIIIITHCVYRDKTCVPVRISPERILYDVKLSRTPSVEFPVQCTHPSQTCMCKGYTQYYETLVDLKRLEAHSSVHNRWRCCLDFHGPKVIQTGSWIIFTTTQNNTTTTIVQQQIK
jgi:hypothetical protein